MRSRPTNGPKIERYGDTTLLALKSVAYDDRSEALAFGDVLLAFGADFVVAVSHDPAAPIDLGSPEGSDSGTGTSPAALVHRVLDALVDAYEPVMDAIDVDIGQIEATVFSPSDEHPTGRIYRLKRQTVEFLRNLRPLREPLRALHDGSVAGIDAELADYFRDVDDHLQRVLLRAENAGVLLAEVLDANLTQVSLRQNEEMRKMSAWAAIFLVPTLLAGIWGMNFAAMPELDWRWGYPASLLTMIAASGGLYWRFRRIGWL